MKKNRILRFFKFIYLKLFRINDTPQKIALGFGLGVFLGILPGTGPLAALFLAVTFKINRAAALLGSLLTNTWLSIITFLLSIRIGSIIINTNWELVYTQYQQLKNNFHFKNLFTLSVLKILLPVVIGYVVIGLISGIFCYIITLLIMTKIRKKRG